MAPAADIAAPAGTRTGGTSLELRVSGLRSARGNVLVCVTANPGYFPDCSKDPEGHRARVAARDAGRIDFDGMTPGRYAVALLHDENANDKLDKAVFVPKEGFGFSRNPVVVAGPPKFGSAAFEIDDMPVTQRVTMKYIL